MAVNVDVVYKTVLTILNKEQRGYLTPAEFNRVGTQVQMEIFEKYFDDINQQFRVPQPNNEFANRLLNTEEKLSLFKTTGDLTPNTFIPDPNPINYILPEDTYMLGTIMIDQDLELQRVQRNELLLLNRSKLTRPNKQQPVYVLQGEQDELPPTPPGNYKKVYVYPRDLASNGYNIVSTLTASYVRKPISPRWGYSIGSVGEYIYDPSVYVPTGLSMGENVLFPVISPTFPAVPTADPNLNIAITNPPTSGLGNQYVVTLVTNGFGVIVSVGVSVPGKDFAVGDQIFLTNVEVPGLTAPITFTLTEAQIQSGSTSGSTDFELHASEQVSLILNILMYTGVIIRDPQIVQNAVQMSMADEQNEKS